MRRATYCSVAWLDYSEISIHALLAESDPGRAPLSRVIGISIHALLAESDFIFVLRASPITGISIHALLAESDKITDILKRIVSNFYPRSPCGERLASNAAAIRENTISIHALLAESDNFGMLQRCPLKRFLSTLSLRRATLRDLCDDMYLVISIHALLAESDADVTAVRITEKPISIHALLAESDQTIPASSIIKTISIHALLAESDHPKMSDHPHNTNFYPRSPCGERQGIDRNIANGQSKFLSTLSLRRATS